MPAMLFAGMPYRGHGPLLQPGNPDENREVHRLFDRSRISSDGMDSSSHGRHHTVPDCLYLRRVTDKRCKRRSPP